MNESTKKIIVLVGLILIFGVMLYYLIPPILNMILSYENENPTKVIQFENIEKQCILDCSDGYRGTSSDCNLFDLRNITDLEKYDCQVIVTEIRRGNLTIK